MRPLLLAVSFLLIFLSCGKKDQGDTAPPVPTPAPPTGDAEKKPAPTPTPSPTPIQLKATQESVQNDFVNQRCISCHSAPTLQNRWVNLTDISKIISSKSEQSKPPAMRTSLIKPGCAKQTFFLNIMKEGKMPPSGKVSDQDLKIISDWVQTLKSDLPDPCKDDEPGGDDGF